MRKRPTIILYLFLVTALLFSSCAGPEQKPLPSPASLCITVFSIGKADAILVQADEMTMLIDAGEKKHGELLLDELKKRGIERLDILEITHFDKDHVGGAALIAENIAADRIIFPDYVSEREEYAQLTAAIDGNDKARPVAEKTVFSLFDVSVTVYPAQDKESLIKEDKEYDNELSLVTRLVYRGKTFLFCGDAEKKRLTELTQLGEELDCDWIKLPHHGGYCKQLKDFLELCSPEYSVMTVSQEDPADERTVKLLKELGIKSFDTLSGSVVTRYDGEGALTVSVM